MYMAPSPTPHGRTRGGGVCPPRAPHQPARCRRFPRARDRDRGSHSHSRTHPTPLRAFGAARVSPERPDQPRHKLILLPAGAMAQLRPSFPPPPSPNVKIAPASVLTDVTLTVATLHCQSSTSLGTCSFCVRHIEHPSPLGRRSRAPPLSLHRSQVFRS